ncbi:MAG: glucosyltransferase domain-containing protein [Clostridium sp.]|nr:glucosyltransferase domain-containing protein [Clostridium sp.]
MLTFFWGGVIYIIAIMIMDGEQNFMSKLNFSAKQMETAKLVALTAFIMGILTHGEMIFYKISMHDDIGLFFSSVGIGQGRWAGMEYDRIIRSLFGEKYSTPVFAGLISILFIAVCAWLLVDMLEIKKKTNIILITSFMVIFPAVAHTFMYMICAPLFFCALFLCAFAAWLTAKFKFGWLYSIPLIAISLGMYQAYLSYFLAVLLLLGTKKALESLSEFRKLAISGLCASGGGVAVYCIVLKLYEAKYNAKASYMGMDHMMEPNILGRLLSIKECYADYISILRRSGYPGLQTTTFMCWMYRVLVVCMVVNLVLYIWKKYQGNLLSAVLSFLSFAFIPIGTNAIHILGTEKTHVGLLTMYPMVIALITIPTLCDWKNSEDDILNDNNEVFYKKMPKKALLFATYASAFFICLNYVYMTNATYLRLSFLQEKLISYQTTLVTRIKSSKGYKDEYPVIWSGNYISDASIWESSEWQNIKLGYAGVGMIDMINNYAWQAFMNQHVGYNPDTCPVDNAPDEIQDAIVEMPCYPDDGSIKVIDEYVVVKLGDSDE